MHTFSIRRRFTFSGRVQGVGFRPAIYRLAAALQLGGWVGNTPAGVIAEVEGDAEQLERFRQALAHGLPPMARIDRIDEQTLAPRGDSLFSLRESEPGGKLTLVPPDLALCEDCRSELFTPGHRRYGYPFINCTQCGPRYSIAEKLPYDRENTVMRRFPVCPACAAEYADPSDRRFHHQTITCPDCGPRATFCDARGERLAEGEAALALALQHLGGDAVLAVKGLGGFHLVANATSSAAIERLRRFKRRPSKPFGVMFGSIEAIERCCTLNEPERAMLRSPASPLLLADWNGSGVDAAIAPGQRRLGVMLPYTPLHALLVQRLDLPLLATSGNRGGEPICIDEREAVAVFAGLVDGMLLHDRPIVRRVDDSVVQYAAGEPRILRRARGWVPSPFPLPRPLPTLLAGGGHLKNTVALSAGDQLVVSAHIGDLDTPQALQFFEETANDLGRLLESEPTALVCDAHPDYASSLWARRQPLPLRTVHHHIAHLTACALEAGLTPPFAGCVWDGSGLGPDGTLWGGETLLFDPAAAAGGVAATGANGKSAPWRRLAHLRPFPLPGGEAAAREPRRALLGLMLAAFDDAAWVKPAVMERFSAGELKLLRHAWQRRINCPLTSSVGRLFDAVACLLGLGERQSFEGEAALRLQTAAERHSESGAANADVRFGFDGQVIDWLPVLVHFLAEIERPACDRDRLAWLLHAALAQSIVDQARHLSASHWLLTGGCFQNRLLLNLAVDRLRGQGIAAHVPSQFPPGDGGLAFGQIAYCSWVPDSA